MSSSGATYLPDLMNKKHEKAIMGALQRLYADRDYLKHLWPAAYDISRRTSKDIPLDEVDVVVLPLDRVGAPAGASGASVFVVYFTQRSCASIHQILASPPLVVKTGVFGKLEAEMLFSEGWPTLREDVKSRFAIPIALDAGDKDIAVLVAPFRSSFTPESDGKRLGVVLKDLWGLLHHQDEVRSLGLPDSQSIARIVGNTLDAMDQVHRDNMAVYSRKSRTYEEAYKWYLRNTVANVDDGAGAPHRSHFPQQLFGDQPTVNRFGQDWPNPSCIAQELMERRFEGVFGPVHGDLHPKNIVIGNDGAVQIIDFGWARADVHVVVDYLLLDINLRGTTLPSQVNEADIVEFAKFLTPNRNPDDLHQLLQPRAKIIKEEIWTRSSKVIENWEDEYIIPFFLVAYGLLVYLDAARNQPSLVASVLAAGQSIRESKR
jgi:hypothetical protein